MILPSLTKVGSDAENQTALSGNHQNQTSTLGTVFHHVLQPLGSNVQEFFGNGTHALNGTSFLNQTVLGGNQTTIANSSSSSSSQPPAIIWVPYLSLVCLIAVLSGLAISFYAHMARVKRRRMNARDYVEKEIDLNRKRLFGMMRTQVCKDNGINDIFGADAGDGAFSNRKPWTQYEHAYSFDEDYFQDNIIAPKFKTTYCPYQGLGNSLDNSDYFQKIPCNINNNHIFHQNGRRFTTIGADAVHDCKYCGRGSLGVDTFCCQICCKENSRNLPIPNSRCISHPNLQSNNSHPHQSQMPPPPSPPPHRHHRHPHHHHCCCHCPHSCLSKKDSMSKLKRTIRQNKKGGKEYDVNNTLSHNENDDDNHCHHHYHQDSCLNQHIHRGDNTHSSICSLNFQNKNVLNIPQNCAAGSPYKNPNRLRNSHNNEEEEGEDSILSAGNKPSCLHTNENDGDTNLPLPKRENSNLQYNLNSSRSSFEQSNQSLTEIESPMSQSPLDSYTNSNNNSYRSIDNTQPLLNIIKPYRNVSSQLATSRKSDSELYNISSRSKDDIIIQDPSNDNSQPYRRTNSEVCLTRIGQENARDEGTLKHHNNNYSKDNLKTDSSKSGHQISDGIINFKEDETGDQISLSRRNQFASKTRSSNIKYQRQTESVGISNKSNSTSHHNEDINQNTRQSFKNRNDVIDNVTGSDYTKGNVNPFQTTKPQTGIEANSTKYLNSVGTDSLQSPRHSNRNRRLSFFQTKSQKQKLTRQLSLKGETNPNFSPEPSDPISTISGKHNSIINDDLLLLKRESTTDKLLSSSTTSNGSKEEDEENSTATKPPTQRKKTKKKLNIFKIKNRPVQKSESNVTKKDDDTIFVSSSSKDDSCFDLVMSPDPPFTAEMPLKFVKRSDVVSNNEDETKYYTNFEFETDVV